ncbi:MAG: beta-N-acetylhexosaminidase [Phycisphaerae bacterium]|nr:beta-N-acetylhexosaminidase [Phycisphaerae bacterium]
MRRAPRSAPATLPLVTADSARRDALGLLCIGFEGTELDSTTALLLRDCAAGVVLFARNFVNREQVRGLISEVRRAAGSRPLIVAVDHEGGRVQRFRGAGFTDLPAARALGAGGDASAVRRVAETAARELRAVGVNLDFAPVLDVDSNPANPVIGERSCSRDPGVVARLGAEFVRALQEAGVAACGKHFPGHGDTHLDSHLDLPRLPHDRARLESIELPPFRAAIDAGVASIMTAHVVFDAIDPGVPATLSAAAIDGLLRRELGFDGMVVSDDLDMKAIADRFEVGAAAVRSVAAGCDLLLCCRSAENRDRAIAALAEAIESGALPRSRVARSLERIRAVADRFGAL